MGQLMAGLISVEDMDDEELARGQFKDKNGKFTGRPAVVIPREIHIKMKQELLRRGNDMFQTSFLEAIKTYTEVARDESNDPAVRLKAAQYVIERIAGKTPDKIEVSGDAPWQIILNKIILETEDGQRHDVVSGEAMHRRTNAAGIRGGDE